MVEHGSGVARTTAAHGRACGRVGAWVALATPGMPAEAWTRARLPGVRRAGGSMVWRRLQRVAGLGVGLVASPGPRRHTTVPWADGTAEALEAIRAAP